MSSPVDNLEEIEAVYILNKHNNVIIAELLTRLNGYEGLPEYTQHASLIASLKICLSKQQLENDNFITDRWKTHVYKTKTGGRNMIHINRNTLHYLLSIGINNKEISKIFHVSRLTVQRWIKDHNLNNLLSDPEDDNVIETYLQEVMNTYKNLGELYARGVLLSKGAKIQRHRLRAILKRLKSSQPLSMSTIRRRTYETRTTNSMWHLDSTHKLIHWRLITSGCVDGCSRKIIWLICSDNNRADTTYGYFLNAIQEFQCPFQVRGDKGVENKMIAKHMIAIRGENMKGFLGGKSTHNTRIERFWREYNKNVMIKFYDEFIELEQLGFLDRTNNNDLWVLHKVYLPVINQKLLEMKTYYNDHPIRSARAKSPNQMYAENALRSQVINTIISPETIDILHDWQNVYTPAPRNNVTVPSIDDLIINEEQNIHVQTILSSRQTNPKSKYINIRAYINQIS